MTFRHLCWLILLAAGVGIEVICVLGLVLLRDAFDRLHCAGAVSLGAALVCAAVVVRDSFSLIGNKAAAIGVMLLLANPVVVHTTARAIRIRRAGDWNVLGDDVEVLER
jgi:monovalent cation/proton antiporter MnhG/PhaG subunit